MGELLTPLDVVIFFGSLIVVMGIGLWAGRKEDTSADYYLAGKSTRWWGVAGSIFGSNVSANHIIGFVGLGFSVGFAQSHFEITAIAGLLLLCYGFLPVYRKLNLYTLSQYLGRRYDDRSRVSYALIMIVVMVIIQMVPGFYIGSRSLIILLQGGPGEIDPTWYKMGIVLVALVTGTYTILGGLKAVIITDVIQSTMLLVAGITVAAIALAQPEIGGWSGMAAMDAATGGAGKLHLYRPMNDPNLPWTGMLSGLMVLHFYYWGTNQFIVQRALSARSDGDAKLGIIVAGFFKLLIPFFSIGTGIAAFYLFEKRGMVVDQDAVFTTLLTELVAPIGWGLLGLVAAGMIGAILSSLDSMMNSSATIVTFDLYQRYINPEASEKRLVWIGRLCVVAFITGAACLTIFVMDPNSEESFFLNIVDHQSRLVAGLVVAFALGMMWKRATAAGALASILSGIVLSYALPPLYAKFLGVHPAVADWFGQEISFFHTVAVVAVLCVIIQVIVSLLTQPDEEKSKLTWVGLGIFEASTLRLFALLCGLSLLLYAVLAIVMVGQWISPALAAWLGAGWTLAVFLLGAVRGALGEEERGRFVFALIHQDRFWAGLLAGAAVFMMYYFY
jgi:solute:Na+ symporter, SSS family